jgi:hypothetical protein
LSEPGIRRGRNWWKSVWPWGIVISLGLAVLSTYVGNSAKASAGIEVGLISVMLTTCVDLYRKSEEEHASAEHLLFDLYQIPPSLQPVISELAPYWRQVDVCGRSHMIKLRGGITDELVRTVKGMADERVATPRDRPYEWMRTDLSELRSYQVIHDDDLVYWNTNLAREYLHQQHLAISHGLKVSRLFIFRDRAPRAAVRAMIAAQQLAGIEVRILAAHDLAAPEDLMTFARYSVNRGVGEDKNGGFLVTSRDSREVPMMHGKAGTWEVLSYRQDDVEEARYGFAKLWSWSQTPEEYLDSYSAAPTPGRS